MTDISFIPNWFFIYSLAFDLIFALITLTVSLYSFKIYNLSNQRQSKLFGLAFLFFSISYFIQFSLNIMIIQEVGGKIISMFEFQDIINLNNLSIFVHMLFFTAGLITLFYMILNFKNKFVYGSLVFVSILLLILSANKIGFFFIFSSILLIIISIYYLNNSIKNNNKRSLLIVIAFFLLLMGHIHFIFLMNYELEYVLGCFLELAAYVLILINFLKALKK